MKKSAKRCAMCKSVKDLQPVTGLVGKHFLFCPSCRLKQKELVEAQASNPYAQKFIKWDKNDICRCEIKDYPAECYRDSKYVYMLETPEETKTVFGRFTTTIHSKCGKPVDPRQRPKDIEIPSQHQFENR